MPHEIVLLRELARLKAELAEGAAGDPAARLRRIADLQQLVALRLERLRSSGTL